MTPNPQDSAVALEVEREAPPNNLPDWSECAMRVANSDFIAKRVAEGGYGPEADSKLATELHRFIYEYDDADRFRSAWFLHRLELLLNETRRASQSDGTSGVPDGWKLVPVEPTTEMLDALHDAIGHDVQTGTSWGDYEEVSVLDVHTFPGAYRAMLAAASNQGENHVG